MSSQVNFHGGKIYKKTQKTIFGSQADSYRQQQVNVVRGGLKNEQDRSCITTLTADASGTTTSLTIASVGANTIRKGDELFIVSKVNNSKQKVVVSQTPSSTDTTLHITSTSLAPFSSGSYIFFSNALMNKRIAGGLLLSIVDLTNAQYKSLGSTEQTLVSADANGYIFPLNVWIETTGYTSSATGETSNRNLYLRYNGGSSTNYLSSIRSFNRQVRSNSTYIFDLTGVSGKIQNSSLLGEALEIQASGNFTDNDFGLRIFTQYQMIGY